MTGDHAGATRDLALAARPEDVRYLDDQRIQLDLAVRMCFTAVLATFISGSLLWRDGMWLLIVPIPGALAYVAYRGTVVSAREYGVGTGYQRPDAGRPAGNRRASRRRGHLDTRLPAVSPSHRRAGPGIPPSAGHSEIASLGGTRPSAA